MNDRLYYLLAISGGLWLAASQGYGMTALPEGTGYFDLMSWQLLFVAGIYFGFTPAPKFTKAAHTVLLGSCLSCDSMHVFRGSPVALLDRTRMVSIF